MNTAIFYLVFVFVSAFHLWASSKNLKLSSIFMSILLIAFFFLAKTDDWSSWFDYAKRYSVIIPVTLLSIAMYLDSISSMPSSKFKKFIACCFLPVLLQLNIIEAVVAAFQNDILLNAFNGLVLCITMPLVLGKWFFNEDHMVGFGERLDWIAAYSLWNCIFIFNIFTEEWNLRTAALLILIIAIGFSKWKGNWHSWLFARAYSLYLILLIDSFYPELMPSFYFMPSYSVMFILNTINLILSFWLIYNMINIFKKNKAKV